ncbi:MAG: hypothetical protein LW834_09090 [Cyanobium sp. 49614_E6]|nr:hypothetical protein [Cyanobium sp. 49614_E6]
MSLDEQKFQAILEAARSRTAAEGVDTMVVSAHLAQMRLFCLRQGVEFFARQDSFAQRREFLRRVVDYNELPGRLEAIVDSFLIDGRGLLYFRPSKDLYRIHFFSKDQFRTYYDEEGALEETQVIYSFRVRPPRGFGSGMGAEQFDFTGAGGGSNSELRWIRLSIFADRIEQTVTNQKPDFSTEAVLGGRVTTLANTLGFIPAVEVFNNRGLIAGSGHGEFDALAAHILQHDRMVKSIKSNLSFFGGPTLVSSRPKHDLLEPEDSGGTGFKATISSNSGFVGLNRASTRSSDPSLSGFGGGFRVPRIIANVEAADRVGYITPDAVSGDLTVYTQQYQEMIRAALGGVDDLSINSGATAYEVRTLYGRVSATAKRKCRDLFEFGFCKLFALMITHEELLFRESLAQALGIVKPEPVLAEELDLPPEEIDMLLQQYEAGMESWRQGVGDAIEQIKQTGEVPPAVVGLIPDGSASIDWRWMGEVFEDSSQEILQNSIVCRNLQELGVASIEALQYLFPSKTPEERAAMLSGYPFRMVEATQRSVGVFMDILRGMFQVPHPSEPDLPLAADPNLDLTPYVYRTLDFLRRELSYSGKYSDVDPASLPPSLSDADRLRATRGQPTELDQQRAQRRRDAFGSYLADAWAAGGGSYTGQLGFGSSMAAGVQSTGRGTDADHGLPGVGGTLSFDPQRPDAGAGGQLGSGPTGGIGAPDLLAPSNAGLVGGGRPVPGGPGGAAADGAGRASSAGSAAGRSAGSGAKRKPAR